MVKTNHSALFGGGAGNLSSLKPFYGFTLAEVLITLGIIGIVASMTLPALVNKYQEKVIVNKLKRTYSEIVNAMDMRRAELGGSNYEALFEKDMTAAEQFDGFIKKLHVIERCSASNTKGCGGDYNIKPTKRSNDGYGNVKYSKVAGERAVLSDGTLVWFGKRNSEGGCITTYTKTEVDSNGNYVLEDGKPVTSTFQTKHCAEIFFDVDGVKGHNQYGYDCYSFAVTKNFADQHSGYGAMFDTMRTGKLNYENYSIGGKF